MTGHVFHEHESGDLRFIGDFDSLYRAEADPWGQSGEGGELASYYQFSRGRLSEALGRLHTGERLTAIEVGAGHGHALHALSLQVGGTWNGLDVSKAAVERAKELHPEHGFYVGDIAGPLPFPPNCLATFDVVIMSQLLWYVLERVDQAMTNAIRLARIGGLVIVSQAFLKGEQRYGAGIAHGWRGALALMLARFPALELIEARYDDTGEHSHHDGLMIFRKVRHAQ